MIRRLLRMIFTSGVLIKRLCFRSHYPDCLCEPLPVSEIDNRIVLTNRKQNIYLIFTQATVSLTLLLVPLASAPPPIRKVLTLLCEINLFLHLTVGSFQSINIVFMLLRTLYVITHLITL